jgi:hypothetical protein
MICSFRFRIFTYTLYPVRTHSEQQQEFCFHHFKLFDRLNLQTLHTRRRNLYGLFFMYVFNGVKFSSFLEIFGIRLPARNSPPKFSVLSCSSSHCSQLDVRLMQFVSPKMFFDTYVSVKMTTDISFSFLSMSLCSSFICCCFCIRAYSVTDVWALQFSM